MGLLLMFFILLLVPVWGAIFNNNIILWRVLVWNTLVFSLLLNTYGLSTDKNFQYFLLQEMLGFLFVSSPWAWLAGMSLMTKAGIGPFFFWALYISSFLKDTPLMWFLTLNKGYRMYFLVTLNYFRFYIIVIYSLAQVYLCMWLNGRVPYLLVLSRVESLRWALLTGSSALSLLYLYFTWASVTGLKGRVSLLSFIRGPFRLPLLLKLLGIWSLIPQRGVLSLILVRRVILSILRMSALLYQFLLKRGKGFTLNWWGYLLLILPLIIVISGYCKLTFSFDEREIWLE